MEPEERRVKSVRAKVSDALATRFALFARLRHFFWSRAYRRRSTWDLAARIEGRDWPKDGETMIGLPRLDNIQSCIEDILRNDIPGDLIETGVWRGGAKHIHARCLKGL